MYYFVVDKKKIERRAKIVDAVYMIHGGTGVESVIFLGSRS